MTRAISGAIIPLKFIEPSCKIDVNLLVSRHENLYSTRERHAEFIGGKIFADPCRTAYILIQTLTRSSNSFSLSLSLFRTRCIIQICREINRWTRGNLFVRLDPYQPTEFVMVKILCIFSRLPVPPRW